MNKSNPIKSVKVTPVSMISHEGLQRVDIDYVCEKPLHMNLEIFNNEKNVFSGDVAFMSGERKLILMLEPPEEDFNARFVFRSSEGNILFETEKIWKKPREWTIYTMLSSHTDIGLHNSQYIQRYNSEAFLDKAMELCDRTDERDDLDKYRYTMEGNWFWSNYIKDRGEKAAKNVVEKYIKPGKIGLCSGIAGNHTHVFGLEEMCRSTYARKWLKEKCGLDIETFAMIDNNGISWAVIQPYVQAGYKNLIFAPNHWNPIKSTLWNYDGSVTGAVVNPEAGGGGSRIDVRYDSHLPMVFYWQNKEEDAKILVWASTQYHYGGVNFGIFEKSSLSNMEAKVSCQLPKLEVKYPYDIWFVASYSDDEEPNLAITDYIKQWNEKWKWPKIRTLGNPDKVFDILRERFDSQIPVLKGEVTGGWYQHPLSTPELLAAKFEVDRLLPTAEKFSVFASLIDDGYLYPEDRFSKAWEYLLLNDEHSYGTSGYQGQRVYETWMGHRDWIEKATRTANEECRTAIETIASHINAEKNGVIVFNPTSQNRKEVVESDGKTATVKIPSLGYSVVYDSEFSPEKCSSEMLETHREIENDFYCLKFNENGSMKSIYDKQLKRELINKSSDYGANEFLYTDDNHKTFYRQEPAKFEICRDDHKMVVTIKSAEKVSGAEIIQRITLPEAEKRIDICDNVNHIRGLYNNDRYFRYLYCAFPFELENASRICHLNGTTAEYAKDLTGHSTDVYMAVNEWCCLQNEKVGIGLIMADSNVVEFDHIHPDKTDFGQPGDGSEIFCYLANDWLQMHTPGGSHLNFTFRFTITSFEGDYKKAGLAEMAERVLNPVVVTKTEAKKGKLDKKSMSFLGAAGNRIIAVKKACDGRGFVARLYNEKEKPDFTTDLEFDVEAEEISVDERKLDIKNKSGFSTYKLCKDSVKIKTRTEKENCLSEEKPAPVGSIYTGLITKPRAARGEETGHLYLLWGQNMEENLSHYKLYRSECADFEASDANFVCDVEPGEYRVAGYQDKGLKSHTEYFYRVCAVNDKGVCGEMSDVFSGISKEETE